MKLWWSVNHFALHGHRVRVIKLTLYTLGKHYLYGILQSCLSGTALGAELSCKGA